MPNFHEAFTQLHLGQLLAFLKCFSRDRRDGGIDSNTDHILRDFVSTLATRVDEDRCIGGIVSHGFELASTVPIGASVTGGVPSYVEQYQATQVEVSSPPKLFFLLPIHTLKLRGQTRQGWREARGQRIRVRVKHKTGASREKKTFHLGGRFSWHGVQLGKTSGSQQ
jgi:hypothetical protein